VQPPRLLPTHWSEAERHRADLALTFADYFTRRNRLARRYEQLSLETREFIEEIEQVGCAPVSLVAVRFHYRSIIDRRSW
jgi:adenylosuccinate synthase